MVSCLVLGLLAWPLPARAASSGQCEGIAPAESACSFTITLASAQVYMGVLPVAYVGWVDVTATSATARRTLNCFSQGVGMFCSSGPGHGSFVKGQAVTIAGDALGAGYWIVAASSG